MISESNRVNDIRGEMILWRRKGASLLAGKAHNRDEREGNIKCCCPPPTSNDESCGREIPLEILVDHIAPFLDRRTYNSCLLLCRRAREILMASWWKMEKKPSSLSQQQQQQQQLLPPWPRKIVSKDPSCRVGCLTFSEDNAMLACGCSDGKIRSWDVRTGELSMPSECHWPDEAVIALSYSNRSDHRLLASSSTDGTIRIWKIHSYRNNTASTKTSEIIEAAATNTAGIAITTTTKRQKISDDGDDDNDSIGTSSLAASCILCIPSDHAVSLHFSPDDSYLVSGHLRIRAFEDLRPTSTIEIRDIRTGLRLRSLEGAGVPVGFLASPPPSLSQKQKWNRNRHRLNDFSLEDDDTIAIEEEHRLISTCGPNTCLKLWSWNRTRCAVSGHENENYDPNIPNILRSHHGPSNENLEHPVAVPAPADYNINDREGIDQYKIALDSGQCIQQWFLGRFNTVLPMSATITRTNYFNRKTNKPDTTEIPKHNNKGSDDRACEILVAVINEPSKNSFAVWNTNSPKDRKVFRNSSPYEIRFSPDGSKIASVDNFNTVKVWRISDGVLLKTFSGRYDTEILRNKGNNNTSNRNRCRDCQINRDCGSTSTQDEGYEEVDSDETSESNVGDDCNGSNNGGGLFPIHELVFSKDSSTVAVISRFHNEVHLFST